jgi:hypothetical protein
MMMHDLKMNPVENGMRPIHPGEILREEFLIPLRLSANALTVALRVPAPRIIGPSLSASLACQS